MASERIVVRLAVRPRARHRLLRIRMRFRASLPAAQLLGRLLRRISFERRAGGSVRLEAAPAEVVSLLVLCGLDRLLRR